MGGWGQHTKDSKCKVTVTLETPTRGGKPRCCYNCGKPFPHGSGKPCPAHTATFNKCKKKGHFKDMCPGFQHNKGDTPKKEEEAENFPLSPQWRGRQSSTQAPLAVGPGQLMQLSPLPSPCRVLRTQVRHHLQLLQIHEGEEPLTGGGRILRDSWTEGWLMTWGEQGWPGAIVANPYLTSLPPGSHTRDWLWSRTSSTHTRHIWWYG